MEYILIKFERDTKYGKYTDGILVNIDDISPEFIRQTIDDRVNKWVNYLDNPPEIIEEEENGS